MSNVIKAFKLLLVAILELFFGKSVKPIKPRKVYKSRFSAKHRTRINEMWSEWQVTPVLHKTQHAFITAVNTELNSKYATSTIMKLVRAPK